jgi:[protein]-arginine 3-hydroxylase / protease
MHDSFLIQLVGAMYVRLYNKEDSPNLYISKNSACGLKGNMSDVDCEHEDWTKYPQARFARYTETLLLPGDCLFIPAHTWRYIRSLSTSFSATYYC